MLQPLTPRQHEVFRCLCDLLERDQASPTVRELMQSLRVVSTSSVVRHLDELQQKGWIERQAGRSRGIALSEAAARRSRGMPWSGVIAAGLMHEAIEQQERIDFAELLHKDKHFTLTVRGDSMVEAHILDGDLVVVRRQEEAAKGQIAVVRTPDGQATVKYWFPEKNRIRLQPANRRMRPLYVRRAEVVGVVVSVVRTL
ncbi:MAG: transcriptional repressor LexA [Pirellulaceae bacterium]